MDNFELAKGLFFEGLELFEAERYPEAEDRFRRSLELIPDRLTTMINLSSALIRQKKFSEARELLDKVLAADAADTEAWQNLGIIYTEESNPARAIECFDRVLALDPNNSMAYNNRGNAQRELKQTQVALASYARAITLAPDNAEAWMNLGNALCDLMQPQAALEKYDHALALKPDYAEAWTNRGNALRRLKQARAAFESCAQAIVLKPGYAEAWNAHGNALMALKQPQDALASFERAIELKPGFAEAHMNRGNVLRELTQPQAALESYQVALLHNPDYAEAHMNRGHVLDEFKEYVAAVESYRRAYALKPELECLLGALLHTSMKICDWRGYADNVRLLEQGIAQGALVSSPFPILGLSPSLETQHKAAEIYAVEKHPEQPVLGAIPRRQRHDRIRIGYYSADFHNHATSYLMARLFELHDKEQFELVGFSFGPDTNDEMRRRVSAAFDRFIDVRNQSDKAVAQLSRELEIDIAVDLKGYTKDCRPDILAYRAAPIQVNYLGFPGTMGAPYIDYLIADKTLLADKDCRYYMEKIIWLPGSYQVNDDQRQISDKSFIRQELGLPAVGFVFGCFNNNWKITPPTFDGWMRILGQVEGSILWLFEDNPWAGENLRKEAAVRGIDPSRLVFASRLPLAEHLARHRAADLFLDTLPYNAHTTASDALWAGLPVLACKGQAFASRVSASLLSAIDMPELITSTQEEYEALAVALATDPERLARIKEKLARNRLATSLFDTLRFTRNLETTYATIYERYLAGLPTENIVVSE